MRHGPVHSFGSLQLFISSTRRGHRFFETERNDQSEFWQLYPGNAHEVAVAIKSTNDIASYSLSMRKIIPLSDVIEVNFPVVRKVRGQTDSMP